MRITDISQLEAGQYYLVEGRSLVYIVSITTSSDPYNMEVKAQAWQISPFKYIANGHLYTLHHPNDWVQENHPSLISKDQGDMLRSMWGGK